jgi:hypothetical protein
MQKLGQVFDHLSGSEVKSEEIRWHDRANAGGGRAKSIFMDLVVYAIILHFP